MASSEHDVNPKPKRTKTGSAFFAIASSNYELGLGEATERETAEHRSSPVGYFFQNVWQKQPAIYRNTHRHECPGASETENGSSETCPLIETIGMNWDDVADLCHNCRHHRSPPLFFQNGTPVTDPHTLYASNPHAAYLDGASIIVNHADVHHPIIARVCENLQRTFPHVYANTYLTPAVSHAVEAHADDRDVLVMQILGKKKWKVYKKVPVEFPFANEQVGKNGREIDPAVFEGGLCFRDEEVILCPGDVLYLPRGYVHEATTEDFDDDASGCAPSFHTTIAIATHDWCLSVLLSESIRHALDGVTKFRKALPIGPCDEYESTVSGEGKSPGESSGIDRQLDEAMSVIRKVTPSFLEQRLRAKHSAHNVIASERRRELTTTQQCKKRKHVGGSVECVGYDAASRLALRSVIRVSTPEERGSVVVTEGQLRGLTVREETMAVLMEILGKLKSDPTLKATVRDLRGLACARDKAEENRSERDGLTMVCDFTLLSFARCCVELGALAVVQQ